MPRNEYQSPADWPELRVRVHPDVHRAVKGMVGYMSLGRVSRYHASMSGVANELLAEAISARVKGGYNELPRDIVESVDQQIPHGPK